MLTRILLTLALATGVVFSAGTAAQATHGSAECPWHWWKGPWHVKQLIKCAADAEGVSIPTSIRVARCESGFDPGEYYNGHAGVYQHALKYWPGRAKTYGFAGWSAYNGRANVYVTMRMVDDGGWNPWSCY
ncbi:MAG: hypothetical protein HY658_06925 [Actinobacteria bacterium]|nr:hypothetical protein [Actinomycetota bacterium]